MVRTGRLIGLIGLVLTGAAAAQLPAFVQQYLQRLGGHLDEARYTVAQAATGDAYRALEPAARDVVLRAAEARVGTLAAAHDAIAGAGELTRPLVFIAHVDEAIAAATWRMFEPGLQLGWGGAAYGLGAAMLTFLAVAGVRRLSRRRRGDRAPGARNSISSAAPRSPASAGRSIRGARSPPLRPRRPPPRGRAAG